MKRIFLASLIFVSFLVKADEMPMVPFTGHSLSIVPQSQMYLPPEVKKNTKARRLQIQSQGFYERDNEYAQFLLALKHNAPSELRAFRKTQDIYDTHLKENANEIKLAFQFKKLPIDDSKIIGYAPIGSYIKSREGWNGIKIFFDEPSIGICAYEFTDLNLSHGGVRLAKEYVKYIINNKPSTTSIEGNAATGFTYSVVWFDGIKRSMLDCAKEIYSKDIIENVIALANKIDRR